MSEILSQKEIDQLLQALDAGGAADVAAAPAARRIRAHDFRTANRIPRDQIKTLGLIYENFARLLSTYLTGTLGVFCECSLASVEEQSFYEFANSITASSLLAMIKMPPLPGSVLFGISPEIAHAVVERLLGGTGSFTAHRRAFTEIDLIIIEKTIRQMLHLVDEAWDKIVRTKTTLESIETSLQFAQIAPPNVASAILTLSLRIGEVDSLITFCIPQTALEPFAKTLNTRLLAAGRAAGAPAGSCRDGLLHSLQATHISLKGILSETTISVHDLMNLQVGDVIQLDNRIQDPIQLRIGHLPRLYGSLGTFNRRYAIRVTGIINEEEAAHE